MYKYVYINNITRKWIINKFRVSDMNKKNKNGFTLTELIVVLVIMAIIAAIAVPFFINYWKKAEFRKNEENAKTVYLAAESKLTYYRSSGQWEDFQKEIKQAVKDGNSTKAEKAVFKDAKDSKLNDRIYTIKLDKDAKDQTKKNNLVLELLDDYTYDKGFFDASISIEIDMESGEVYSAFYGSRCKGLNYKSDDADGYLTMQKRDYDSRSKRLLGYYSTDDAVNTVDLKAKRLRITTINLANSEKLSLDWSSNAGTDLGVEYKIAFYKKDSKEKLFELRVSPFDMRTQGWDGGSASKTGMAALEVTKKDGTKDTLWSFPVTYNDNKYSLVLDAMMSAKTQAVLDSQKDESAKSNLEKSSSTSITRLAEISDVLAEPQNIYATVTAAAYSGKADRNTNQEYRNSDAVTSNTANTMFGDDTKGADIQVSAFRHLSNMRYYEKNHKDTKATFTLSNKNMDWASVGTGVYDLEKEEGSTVEKLNWEENTKTQTVGFPAIGTLPANYTLKGDGKNTLVSNLHLNEESAADDGTADKLKISRTEFLGLFKELKGTVKDVTFRDPSLEIGQDNKECQSLKGIGILAGRSEGSLENVAIISSGKSSDDSQIVKVNADNNTAGSLGVGAVAGVIAGYENDQFDVASSGKVSGLSVEGKIEASLPDTAKENEAYGIGGIAGYAKLENKDGAAKIENCENHADISGNMSTGGIVGRVDGTLNYKAGTVYNAARLKEEANILNSTSDGLILCTTDENDSSTTKGNYFGGITGYSDHALIYKASSASGRAGNFSYSKDKENLLLGTYVGGITGYGNYTLLSNCSTEKNGYILGENYVGGIAGGFGEGVSEAIQSSADAGASVTTNASYVIGKNYVGGIVGMNAKNVTLKNCVNNGVTAGYEKYVGGIVGYNEDSSTILDCASYLSDYDSSIYNMIVKDWKATADYAGGIAGYNDGQIKFTNESEAVTVKSISSIVVGDNYVGGIAGFNDQNASIDVHYTLIGGRIYAYGSCAGGAFGLNASEKVLTSELTIKPQSIQGKYYVGGCIGANVVDLDKDTAMTNIRTDNILGRITGQAFCGGIIGYQRTYTHAQLGLDPNASIKDRALSLLPEVNEKSGVPNKVAESANEHRLNITTTNNIPIRAGLYTGGIVGYCEKNSRLLLDKCTNKGDIALAYTNWSAGVSLGAYIRSGEIGKKNVTSDANSVNMHFAGGIISVNLENQVIDNCSNTGNMSGYTGTGGVVGLNAGLVCNCSLQQNFGSAALNYIGGIAGINVGTIESCTTARNKTISGKANIGGIVGWNLNGGVLTGNKSLANVSASGNTAVGGIAGRNNGNLILTNDDSGVSRSVSGANASGVGGIVGINEAGGTLTVTGTSNEIDAVGNGVSVIGLQRVGGIVGVNRGTIGHTVTEASEKYLASNAKLVRASRGYAGGIVGETHGNINCAVNHSTLVTADEGYAGGITAINHEGQTIRKCKNFGNVSSSKGYASGIAAHNIGTITDCVVKGTSGRKATISSVGVNEMGAVTAENTGTILNSRPEGNVVLNGNATVFGGVTGSNSGTIGTSENKDSYEITEIPAIDTTKGNLIVGGVAGQNYAKINNVKVNAENAGTFKNFTGYHYLGGIVGENSGKVTEAKFAGTIIENSGTTGNCYGAIAGINEAGATLKDCTVDKIIMQIHGVYSAASTSSADEKEKSATHAGGIVGKNEKDATVDGCSLADNKDSKLTAEYGMLGGVTGFNKGTIKMSGSSITNDVMNAEVTTDANATEADKMAAKARAKGLKEDSRYVNWNESAQVENLSYRDGTRVTKDRLQLFMTKNGNIGGITAYNGTTGELTECVSGNWFLANKSDAIGVGTGGIIGMNESEKNLSKLVNGAFVGRQLSSGDTNRFAGGIIGNQNNSTSRDWTIDTCINFGMVYCYNAHYSGGIIGQWTGSGGNIQNCQNYGSLQTTFNKGWFGAAAGIVAQLYHANEDNEYNIIGCGNFGSIYGRKGESVSDCANDSAGILGNVTAYRNDEEGKGQKYKIQVIDCVNGPNVKIYSASMASGIVGFFSADDAANLGDREAGNMIKTSTENIKLRMERCQNYASVLSAGGGMSSGILGDRYGKTGCANTVVTNCYSVNIDNYQVKNNPIFSFTGYWGGANTSYLHPKNRVNNYFIQREGNKKISFTNVNINHSDNNKQEDTSVGDKITATNDLGESGIQGSGDRQRAQYAQYEFVMYDMDKKQYFVAAIEPKKGNVNTTVNNRLAYIDKTGRYIRSKDKDELVGEVLFYLDKNYTDINQITGAGSEFYKYARESYRRIEGINHNKLLEPASATATVENGKINLNITPQDLPDSAKNEKCDPFKYKIHIVDSTGKEADKIIYSENESFDIPSGLSGDLSIDVRASSMYPDVADSDACKAEVKQVAKVLPEPDVRAELVLANKTSSSGQLDYRYQFSLNNIDDYKDYPGWQVEISLKGYDQKVVLSEDNKTDYLKMDLSNMRDKKKNTYQINAKATTGDTNNQYEDSPLVSTSAYMPYYQAFIGLRKPTSTNNDKLTNIATPTAEMTGNTLDDLTVNIKLDNSNSNELLEVTPIYRAELVGNWKDSKETVVFAKTDIMTVSKGVATASFHNLPDYLKDAKNLRVRLWYARTGLGPVYLYHEISSPEEGNTGLSVTRGDGVVRELTDVKDGQEQWAYEYSLALSNPWNDFYPYTYESGTLLDEFLEPVMDLKDGSTLEPVIDEETGKLQYKFSWDKDVKNGKYKITLTGIDQDGKEVIINTDAYDGSNSYTADADDWNYRQVKLKVTRIGEGKKVGVSTEATYNIANRLERPSQPSVEIDSENELLYNLSWTPITSEEGCSGYQAYIRVYDDNGELGKEKAIGKLITPEQKKDGSYAEQIDLEKYAGQRVVIYLKAMADKNSEYLDSVSGISYELDIPKRLAKPNVKWSNNWKYDLKDNIEAKKFEDGAMKISLTADDGSIPPGGSAYLLRACVYDNKDAADAATETDPGTYIKNYPADASVVQMDAENAHNYSHELKNLSIEYAGKWIVFYTRISSGGGNISSEWAKSDAYRLPYVKLESPQVTSEQEDYELKADVTETPDVPGEEKTWTAKRTALTWNSIKCADLFALDLNGTVMDGTDKNELSKNFRIRQTKDGITVEAYRLVDVEKLVNGKKVTSKEWQWQKIEENAQDYPEGTPEQDIHHVFNLSDYSVAIESTYKAENGGTPLYSIELGTELDVVKNEDGTYSYTLRLPDISNVTAHDGCSVTHDNFNISQNAVFTANVTENIVDDKEDQKSTAYIKSDETKIEWKK